jgi:hypothetical protein
MRNAPLKQVGMWSLRALFVSLRPGGEPPAVLQMQLCVDPGMRSRAGQSGAEQHGKLVSYLIARSAGRVERRGVPGRRIHDTPWEGSAVDSRPDFPAHQRPPCRIDREAQATILRCYRRFGGRRSGATEPDVSSVCPVSRDAGACTRRLSAHSMGRGAPGSLVGGLVVDPSGSPCG